MSTTEQLRAAAYDTEDGFIALEAVLHAVRDELAAVSEGRATLTPDDATRLVEWLSAAERVAVNEMLEPTFRRLRARMRADAS